MAYDKNKLYKKAIKVIEDKGLIFITDVIVYLGISTQTFYTKFPMESKELEIIKDMLDSNKTNIKAQIRVNWYQSGHFQSELCLYKLCATDEEREALSTNYTKADVKHDGKIEIEFVNMDDI